MLIPLCVSYAAPNSSPPRTPIDMMAELESNLLSPTAELVPEVDMDVMMVGFGVEEEPMSEPEVDEHVHDVMLAELSPATVQQEHHSPEAMQSPLLSERQATALTDLLDTTPVEDELVSNDELKAQAAVFLLEGQRDLAQSTVHVLLTSKHRAMLISAPSDDQLHFARSDNTEPDGINQLSRLLKREPDNMMASLRMVWDPSDGLPHSRIKVPVNLRVERSADAGFHLYHAQSVEREGATYSEESILLSDEVLESKALDSFAPVATAKPSDHQALQAPVQVKAQPKQSILAQFLHMRGQKVAAPSSHPAPQPQQLHESPVQLHQSPAQPQEQNVHTPLEHEASVEGHLLEQDEFKVCMSDIWAEEALVAELERSGLLASLFYPYPNVVLHRSIFECVMLPMQIDVLLSCKTGVLLRQPTDDLGQLTELLMTELLTQLDHCHVIWLLNNIDM